MFLPYNFYEDQLEDYRKINKLSTPFCSLTEYSHS